MAQWQTAIVTASTAPLIGRPARAFFSAWFHRAIGLALVGAAAVAASGYLWVQTWLETTPPSVAPLDVYALFVDSTPVVVTVYAGGEYAPWPATAHAIRTDAALWRRMHLANWNTVPAKLRAQGLDALFAANRSILTNPRRWDSMTVRDWDLVPQPIRTVAYRQMVAYWTGFYGVGRQYGLPHGSSAIRRPQS